MRVINDLSKDINILFPLDDIVRISASRFEDANSHEDVLKIISNLKQISATIIKTEVGLYDKRSEGIHSYEIYLSDSSCWNIPIW
ncbi:MAG: hypothetical protein AABW90_01375 [Nanoarchaeota archaeon]